MPPRFVFVTLGSYGDVFPVVGLARATAAAGHDVLLASSPGYELLARGERLPFAAIAADPSGQGHRQRAFSRLPPAIALRSPVWLDGLAEAVDALDDVVEAGDVLVVRTEILAGPIVARRRGLHYATVSPHLLLSPTADLLPPMVVVRSAGRVVNRVAWSAFYRWIDRRFLGDVNDLIDEPSARFRTMREVLFSPELALVLGPRAILRRRDVAGDVTVTGGIGWDTPRLWRRRRELVAFLDGGAPPVLLMLPYPTPVGRRVRDAMLAFAARTRHRLVISDPSREAVAPRSDGSVLVTDYVPLSVVGPRLAGAVHTGSIGTSTLLACAGVPCVVVPMLLDQFENAETMSRLGVAHHLSVRRLDATRLATAVDDLDSLRDLAVGFAPSIDDEGGIERAAAHLTAWAGRAPADQVPAAV